MTTKYENRYRNIRSSINFKTVLFNLYDRMNDLSTALEETYKKNIKENLKGLKNLCIDLDRLKKEIIMTIEENNVCKTIDKVE